MHLSWSKKKGLTLKQDPVFTGEMVVGDDGLEPPTYAL
jgi:hypothetical protein